MSPLQPVVVGLAILVLCSPVVAGEPSADNSSDAVPDNGPAYGLNESEFYRLWSEDVDDNDLSLESFDQNDVSSRGEFERGLANSTDIPSGSPPQAVEKWNDGDVQDYSPGGTDTSVYPENANLTDGTYIRDAFVSIFAAQPSTILHENETSHHIAPDGEVLAISDYRVLVPEDETDGAHREFWSLRNSQVREIGLTVDGEQVSSASGHQTILEYSNLSGNPELTITATVTAELELLTKDCTSWNSSSNNCDGRWEEEVEIIHASQSPTVSKQVTVNRLTGISGKRVRFEEDEGLVGAAVNPDTRWSTITVDGDVRARSNWWFYTTGKPGWQTMVTASGSETVRNRSSVRPVQTHAYPADEDPHVPTQPEGGEIPLEIEETWGANKSGPSLPSNIDLGAEDPFTNADSIALSSSTLKASSFKQVTVAGIVRGQSETVTLSEEQTVRETNLSLSFTATNSTQGTVLAKVTEASTDDPVTSGNVTVAGQTEPINDSGMATITVRNPSVFVRGAYTPAHWWRTDDPYAGASAVTSPPANFPSFQALARLAVVTLLWFLPLVALVVAIDRLTSGTRFNFSDNS
ncbi:hypothetical protein BV210_02415 [Halorientalis sp. IM1011]|uniref:hypothetical protein n=1 Tax=Halorientalis sp. IM1011 TaxID=1932360 RepID=UPI00097CCF32|nr:hypothetical protein [Halorientalis sp. IM1011]AQL41637.1 hypothetical protein BV210_02415 [Halorientalis sp. IM1011]